MAKLLEEAGVPVELLEVKGRDHFTIGNIGAAEDEIAGILADWLFKITQSEIRE